MTESVEAAHGTSSVPLSSGEGSATAGALLKKAREEAGLHIGTLAVSLKVPVNKLEALESGNLEVLSGAVFVRALASSVCRSLKIDAAPILNLLPQASTVRLHQKGELNEPFRGDGRGMSFSSPDSLLKPSILAVVALLIGAVVLTYWPNLGPIMPSLTILKESTIEASPPAKVMNEDDVTSPVESLAASSPALRVLPSPKVATPPLLTPPLLTHPEEAALFSPALAGLSTTHVSGPDDVVTFKAIATSWVEVTNDQGLVVLRKTLSAGETTQIDVVTPLRVVVGRADVTEVTVRGKRLELKVLSKDNVARFEVK